MKPASIELAFGLALLSLGTIGSSVAEGAGAVGGIRGAGACGQYRVFAPPLPSPDLGDRTLEVCPADVEASPFGWHDIDGVEGAEFTDTQGNNAIAQEDRDGDNQDGFRPDGGPGLDFDFPLDLDLPPEESVSASVTHAFYWFNLLHDVHYRYGFDEAAGNFQENNYGRGGLGGDPLTVEVQDPFGLLIVTVPPDGISLGRVEIPELTPIVNSQLTVTAPSSIAGEYEAARGDWGGALDEPIAATIEIVDDGSGSHLACAPLVGFTPGNVALIFRGSCEFGEKALVAEEAGAVAAIIVNDDDTLITMNGGQSGDLVTIPAVMIRSSDGAVIRSGLPGVEAELATIAGVIRDGVYDNMTLAHAYGHGLSQRLTGGPGNSSCLSNLEQMGEGWSDFDALWFTAAADDQGADPRPYAAYSVFEPADGVGVRDYPYTTDLSVNPHTYDDIKAISIPHGVGSVWAAMVWEVYWNLVERYGFDPDLYAGSGGNNLARRLVTDGLTLQPCNPHFVDGRDAIFAADLVATGGENRCEIWRGFAKRGLGVSADAGSGASVVDGVEAFDLPVDCGPDLNAAGTCPGTVTLRAAGLTSGVSLLVAGNAPGSTTIPSGPCAGTELGIANARPVAFGAVGADGTRSLEATLGETRCGKLVQIVDSICRVSGLAGIPSPPFD